MRWSCVLLLLASAAIAQDPFAPPAPDFRRDAVPGVRARFAESLALLKSTLERDPAHLAALERTGELLRVQGREADLIDTVRHALTMKGLLKDHKVALGGLLGYLLVQESGPNVRVIFIGGGGRVVQPPDEKRTKQIEEAIVLLLPALELKEHQLRTREALFQAFIARAGLKEEQPPEEAGKLAMEIGALRARSERESTWARHDMTAQRLRAGAERLEQRETPDHAGALVLRKQALVMDFCAHTIPFEYEPSLYGPVSLLATRGLVQLNLARSYLKASGDTDYVAPQYYPAAVPKRGEIVKGLALDTTDGSAAALLAVIRTSNGEDPVARRAIESLVEGKHGGAKKHLPRMLEEELLGAPTYGRRLLVELAAELKLVEAGPVLVEALACDTDLVIPLGVARALGRIGYAPAADPLIAIARETARDVYFRRQAVDGLGMLAPERLEELPEDPLLEISVAAARFRREPNESDRGRILAGLGRPHETDEAAEYCAELGIREAVPLMERLLKQDPNHVAAQTIRYALGRLR